MKEIYFFDIDDTLLPVGKEGISIENIEAIKKLQQTADVYIATGKSIAMAQEVLEVLGLNNSITSNGSVVQENGEIVYSKNIADEHIEEIKQIVNKRPGTIIGGQGNNASYVLVDKGEIYRKYVVPIFTDLSVEIPKTVEEFKEDIYQLWLLGDLEGIEVKDEKFDSFRWNKNGLDIVYKNTSKAQGIQYLLDTKYKDKEVKTYGFGDSLNDIPMFKLVDVSVAMSNAKDELKEIANYITDNSENKGIANFLKSQKLI